MNASPRLFIINGNSPYFFSIPMGTFGLSDYLNTHGIPTVIFNPSLYPVSHADKALLTELDRFQPTHIGLILHWQETADGMIQTLRTVRSRYPELPALCGGFTASFFGPSLLETCPELDYVILGDPELPVRELMLHGLTESVPNLVYRANGEIRSTPHRWLADSDLLNRLSFAGLDALIDADTYLAKCSAKLGLPLFIGRGCVFDCDYCGGSRTAFAAHSCRNAPALRSIDAILKDLHLLAGRIHTLYLCFENSPRYIIDLFEAIADSPGLRQQFRLNYGAWHLPGPRFIQAYRAAFLVDRQHRPLFEFSPELISDKWRRFVKKNTIYTLEEMLHSIKTLNRELDSNLRVELFFSRYHQPIGQTFLPWKELAEIVLLKHRLFREGLANVHSRYDHLSTDVGSQYWQKHVAQPSRFATLLRLKQEVDQESNHPFPMGNLCLHIPPDIDRQDLLLFEMTCHVLKLLERDAAEVFHILIYAVSSRLPHIIAQYCAPRLHQAQDFFQSDDSVLVDSVLQSWSHRPSGLPEIVSPDLLRFARRKLSCLHTSPSGTVQPCDSQNPVLLLNDGRTSIHEYDYLQTSAFLQRLDDAHGRRPPYERTVCFFLADRIVTMPHRTFRHTLQRFQHPLHLNDYLEQVQSLHFLAPSIHREMIENFLRNGILVEAGRQTC